MNAKPLTKKEKAWLDKLERVMNQCPSKRLACYTIGDNDLTFYDASVSNQWERDNPNKLLDAGALHTESGSRLYNICGSFNIDSCADAP